MRDGQDFETVEEYTFKVQHQRWSGGEIITKLILIDNMNDFAQIDIVDENPSDYEKAARIGPLYTNVITHRRIKEHQAEASEEKVASDTV